jgi:hypothetical protein
MSDAWNEKFRKQKAKIEAKAKFKIGQYIRIKDTGSIFPIDDIEQDDNGNIKYAVMHGGSMIVQESDVEAAPPGTYGECLLV